MRAPVECSIEGCDRPVNVHVSGLCRAHYLRRIRLGDPLAPSLRIQDKPIAQRLLEKIEIDENGCWIWQGSMRHRYGEIILNGRRQYPHRLSFEAFVRPLEPREVVCHRCDNPPCLNPDHLFAGTQTDNMRDMMAKGRAGGQFRPQPINHGTASGEKVHRNRGEAPCRACRDAKNARQREYRSKKRAS